MRRLWIAVLAVGAVTVGWPISAALADELLNSLDSALAAGDEQQVISIVRDHTDPAAQAEIAKWLRDKVDMGLAPDSFGLTMVLLSLREKKVDDALMYLSYYRALVSIDSATCTDPSSGGSMLESTIFLFGRLTANKDVTEEQKRSAVDRAISLEMATSSARKKDPALCAAGLTAYAKALNVPLQQPPQPAEQNGQDPVASRSSRYNDDPLWRETREKVLPNLKDMLLVMMGIQKPR